MIASVLCVIALLVDRGVNANGGNRKGDRSTKWRSGCLCCPLSTVRSENHLAGGVAMTSARSLGFTAPSASTAAQSVNDPRRSRTLPRPRTPLPPERTSKASRTRRGPKERRPWPLASSRPPTTPRSQMHRTADCEVIGLRTAAMRKYHPGHCWRRHDQSRGAALYDEVRLAAQGVQRSLLDRSQGGYAGAPPPRPDSPGPCSGTIPPQKKKKTSLTHNPV